MSKEQLWSNRPFNLNRQFEITLGTGKVYTEKGRIQIRANSILIQNQGDVAAYLNDMKVEPNGGIIAIGFDAPNVILRFDYMLEFRGAGSTQSLFIQEFLVNSPEFFNYKDQ